MKQRLEQHLRTWLGEWPPSGALVVVGYEAREQPGWDGAVHDVIGVSTSEATLVSVPPAVAKSVGEPRSLPELSTRLGDALGRTGRLTEGAFRWSEGPAPLEDAGVWLAADDPRVPSWLRPFGGEVLVVLDDDQYVAGVGVKRHDAHGHEIAVGTEEQARGRGLARRLVAQAARVIIARGAVPTYLHEFSNVASAHVAEAAGFPDRGWRVLGFSGEA